ncbi:Protein of unknown function [Solimonas aquatica]|uniref:Uncharacterized protein n=1 Tax=Solimonas aquatica TaxID=489703 RepID=A0A1H8ZIK9_9GAMM|nr:DUF3467 domain-containing protein [Solimonas aquatica]SEP64262.1 Protein of unknown function [Solimonas aquatica]
MALSDESVARYANHFRIGHNASEFMIEFAQRYEAGGKTQLVARLVVTPQSARELHSLLGESLRDHEALPARARRKS